MKEESLIFIISQPRAGSTYLQNLLSNNSEANTCSEPWLLLNFVNQIKPELIKAPFDNSLAHNAFKDYIDKYKIDFNLKQKQFLLSLYKPVSEGFTFVIDKTPRYWEILNEIILLFPKSKIIILKRNPIDVVKSIIKTWEVETLERLNYYKRDLFLAPKKIHSFCEMNKNNDNIFVIRYEDLVQDTSNKVEVLYNWLGIGFHDAVLDVSKNHKFKGKYGDPYQNAEVDEMINRKIGNEKYLENEIFIDFLKGYAHYLGNDFLFDYGNYQLKSKTKTSRKFKAFMYLGDYENIDSIKNSREFKIGKLILKPIRFVKNIL
ncbi:sulfotransferase family protein [Mariniflexile fucanivorans]|uniref:Sulfotransferase family protein n=1 Tax=Mariniflexile fucanivorans TaxID=264023 RepID=A0A4R1RDD1_9FLAO|nr:sulfotransferase [Mariniflexile fucanivorans]TCL63875.1 sulfotransferase family protein [Mariniflexile fucanivorans]